MAMDMAVALKINAGVTGQQAVDQLRTSMDKLDGAAQQVGRGFNAARSAVGAFIALQAVQAVSAFARETINAADKLEEMAERTGLTVQALSELDYASKLNGKSLDDVQSALSRIAVKATEAATGNKAAADVFDALGISVKTSTGEMRASLDITEQIGDVFREISDPTLKAALAVELFGKQGPTLIPLIEKLQATRQDARDLGAVVGDDFAKAANEFNDNVDRMNFMAKGFAATILSSVIPSLSNLFTEFRTGIKVFGSFSSALWNIGTTNPFSTPLEQAKHYSAEVTRLQKKLDDLAQRRETAFTRDASRSIGRDLDEAKKLAEYFRQISGYQEAGAGRGFINPPLVQPSDNTESRARSILDRLNQQSTSTNEEQSRQERERISILQRLRDEVAKLTQGEDELTLARLRALGASEAMIKEASVEMARRKTALADKAATDVIRGLRDEIDKLAQSEEELMASKMRAAGATEAQVATAREEFQTLQRLTAAKKESEEATRRTIDLDRERLQVLEGLRDEILSLERGEDELAITRMEARNASREEIEIMRTMQAERKRLREAQQLQNDADSVRQSTRTPAEVASAEFARLSQMYQAGAIDLETYTRAVRNANDAYLKLGKDGTSVMDELKNAIDGWGKSSADAFVQFAFNAGNSTQSVKSLFSDMVRSILQDIAKMLIYKNITGPIFNAIGGMLPGAGAAGSMVGAPAMMAAPVTMVAANGGIMTAGGPLPLNKYAAGGIATSPQLALFGEGRMPEAYVPLPDGRSIPVTMEGGGGSTNVVVNVNMETGQQQAQGDNQRGTDLGLVIASVVKQELINQRRPGGVLAAA